MINQKLPQSELHLKHLEAQIKQYKQVLKWIEKAQIRAIKKIRNNNFVFDDLDERWQKLAFTFYTDICELSRKAKDTHA